MHSHGMRQLAMQILKVPPRWTVTTSRWSELGNFKDVRFYPILNFGLFLGRLLEDVPFLPHPKFSSILADPIFSAVRSTFLAEEEAQRVEIFSPPRILAFFGLPS